MSKLHYSTLAESLTPQGALFFGVLFQVVAVGVAYLTWGMLGLVWSVVTCWTLLFLAAGAALGRRP